MFYVLYFYDARKYCFMKAYRPVTNFADLGEYVVKSKLAGSDNVFIVRECPSYAALDAMPDRIQPWDVDSFVDSGLGFHDDPVNHP